MKVDELIAILETLPKDVDINFSCKTYTDYLMHNWAIDSVEHQYNPRKRMIDLHFKLEDHT